MKVIVTVSGGLASAWCADWALKNYPKEDVVLYFNDTKWEHPDLYRFLDDLSKYLDHPIISDSDGRTPDQLFRDNNALANNRMPFCSRILKAERLQKYYKDGDVLLFGINSYEPQRAQRLIGVYQMVAVKRRAYPKLRFPLIENNISDTELVAFFIEAGIEIPELYKLGFAHNNCAGGCVRAGKRSWKLLLEKLPEVYSAREAIEEELRNKTGKDIHFFKDETLKAFRVRCENGELSSHYYKPIKHTECFGICNTQS